MSVNYTLSHPTSNGEWMLAAARHGQVQGVPSTNKNTIAVFRLDNAYNILDSRVIGFPGGMDGFHPDVDFEIHCIVESVNPMGNYIICGSIRRDNVAVKSGLVVVTDAGLNPLSIREYPDVLNFYSVYAQENYYYVCGRRHDGSGIVLRDDVTAFAPMAMAYVTYDQWDYQKIRVVTNPGTGVIKVSGTGFSGIAPSPYMGYSIFNAKAADFSPVVNPTPPLPPNPIASWKFQPSGHGIGSKVVIANHPGGSAGNGVVLSVSNGDTIYTYLFFQQPEISAAFKIPISGVLEDVECAGEPGPQIAWVGNTDTNIIPRQAYYLHMDIPPFFIPPPSPLLPFPSVPVAAVYFSPSFAAANAYYSLHKVYFHKNGDLQFHAGGYYNDSDNNRTTFVVTPDFAQECVDKQAGPQTTDIALPSLQSLDLIEMHFPVNELPRFSKRYIFCEMDCYKSNCGNKEY